MRDGKSPVNGHTLSSDFLNPEPAAADGGKDSKVAADREATRYLSAATQIDIDYAKTVVDRVFNEQLKALAPTFGVDVPVVAKWAMKALHTRAVRDYTLSAVLVLEFMFILVLILWWPWAWVPSLILLICAWLIVAWDHDERINKVVIGRLLHDRFSPADAPAPPREVDLDRLRIVARRREGNLVVFSGHDAFIGSGKPMYRRRLLLDVSAKKDDEASGKPSEFTSHDLLAAIAAAFDRKRGLGKTLDNIRVHERLFINGLHVQGDPRLLPDKLRPPLGSVDADVLREAALNPSPAARTYVCVEMPGWQGQLVVTLFIRAVYAGKSLFVEWTFRVLPPIREKFRQIDEWYERPRYLQVNASLGSGLRSLVPALFSSPVHSYRLWSGPWRAQRKQDRSAAKITRGYVFDYGARRSIREDASGSQRQHYFLARDESMYVLLAQQTLMQTVGELLREHGVDLGQFEAQVKVIFDQSINYNVGDISGSTGIAIGQNSSARVGEPPQESQ